MSAFITKMRYLLVEDDRFEDIFDEEELQDLLDDLDDLEYLLETYGELE